MLRVAGGDNVFADIQREAVEASTELILSRRPDVILEIRTSRQPGDAGHARRQKWPSGARWRQSRRSETIASSS